MCLYVTLVQRDPIHTGNSISRTWWGHQGGDKPSLQGQMTGSGTLGLWDRLEHSRRGSFLLAIVEMFKIHVVP